VKLIGELIKVISERGGLPNIRAVGELLKTDRRPSEVLGSDLLELGQLLIAGMKHTTGNGDPDTGARFGHAYVGFERVGHTLDGAQPTGDWEGAGARAYADQNTRQRMRTEAMSGADREVHRVLFREAAQIQVRRNVLDEQSEFLAKTSLVTFPLQFIPRYGEAAKLAIEAQVLRLVLVVCAEALYSLHRDVSDNARELQKAIGRYAGVADGTEKLSDDSAFDAPILRPDDAAAARADAGQSAPAGDARAPGGVGSTGVDTAPPQSPGAPVLGPVVPTPTPTPPNPPSIPPAPTVPSVPPVAAPAAAAPAATVGPLGALLGSLAGLVTSAVLAATAEARERQKTDEQDVEENEQPDSESPGAAPGPTAGESAPISEPTDSEHDELSTRSLIRLDAETSGPPAGTPPQDGK